jgi:hypothetical protein
VHEADPALRALHELSVFLARENPKQWMAKAMSAWLRCASIGTGTSRRELDSIRSRLLGSLADLRRASEDGARPDEERTVAGAAARKLEDADAMLAARREGVSRHGQ